MDQFNNVDLEFANFEDYVEFEFSDFEDEEQQTVPENPPRRNTYNTDSDSDCEHDFQTVPFLHYFRLFWLIFHSSIESFHFGLEEQSNVKTDTSAFEARNGKDIQGIPWEKLNYSRDEYRETRLKQYKNYESLTRSREDLDKVNFFFTVESYCYKFRCGFHFSKLCIFFFFRLLGMLGSGERKFLL